MEFLVAFFGAILALFGFVMGQYILKLVIEPIQGLRKTIGEISHALIVYSVIFSNPQDEDNERKNEVYEKIRNLSGQLMASYYLIPKRIRNKEGCWTCLYSFDLPSKESVSLASHNLQTLTNCLYPGPTENTNFYNQIRKLKKDICDDLDIFNPDNLKTE